MPRLIIGPFNRVEGDLEVTLDVDDGVVRTAWVNSPLYRGFEQILVGKEPLDALVVAPRICGICSVSQSVAAARALAAASNLMPPPNGLLAGDLIGACENLSDHYTHFHVFFMPDLARDAYAGRAWHAAMRERFAAVHGSSIRAALAARAGFMKLMGYLAGKWPHTLTLQPGGSARPIEAAEKLRLSMLLGEFRSDLETRLFGDRLEAIAAIDGVAALTAWMDARAPASSDFRLFLEAAYDLELHRVGRATDHFLSYGAYAGTQDGRLFPSGHWQAGRLAVFDVATVTEDVSHAWMNGPAEPLPPAQGVTQPLADKTGAYTWCKAPRLAGQVVETGALARQVVAGHPLLVDMVTRHGGSVTARVVARMIELARVLPAMEAWVKALKPGEPFCLPYARPPEETMAVGLTEAARGSLGHWLHIRQGRIHGYQIIAPTTWNFSPRDAAGTPGALEQALVGLPVAAGETTPLMVQHVVRSFDPCMVCTVH
ncbi:MAG: nickel-dependent hydrogenase large subunit [Ectothiorhodospiraceae bacterium]|nr:nickel-dependent hydrogenase large subunit [Ectothiorhodospiraceae bacterium]